MSDPNEIADATEDPTNGSFELTEFPEDEFPELDQSPDLILHDFDEPEEGEED